MTLKRPTTAWMSANLFQEGIGYVNIARFKASGEAEIGVFLLDVWCLGVKNAFFAKLTPCDFESMLARLFQEAPSEISPGVARHLVESAAAYAGKLGFRPHEDHRAACRVMGGIEAKKGDTVWTFGQDGKPHYISGPHDSQAFINRVLKQLLRTCGEGNYNFTVMMADDED